MFARFAKWFDCLFSVSRGYLFCHNYYDPLVNVKPKMEVYCAVLVLALILQKWALDATAVFTARCYAPAVLAMGLCLCLSVTSRSSTKTAKRRITETTPHDSPGNLLF